MRLLVLGGTGFVGRAVVTEALARRADVTVLNRGRRPAIPGVTAVTGDRGAAGGLAALPAGEWDLVVDTWSGAPAAVRDAARALAGRTRRYGYVSSRSVYAYPPPAGAAEDAPLVDGDPDAAGEVAYPQAKRGAEIAVDEVFGDRAVLARAGLVLGPHEDIGRLPWWLLRIARGGTVAAPGPPTLGLQYVDVRDLAAFLLDAGVHGSGAYNVVSPPGHTTMGELLDTCLRVTGSGARLRWVTAQAVAAAGVQPWTQLPCWLPPGPEHDGMHGGDVSRAVAAGLHCRAVADTVADTWAWLQGLGGPPPLRPDRPRPGLDADAEANLLRVAAAAPPQ